MDYCILKVLSYKTNTILFINANYTHEDINLKVHIAC